MKYLSELNSELVFLVQLKIVDVEKQNLSLSEITTEISRSRPLVIKYCSR